MNRSRVLRLAGAVAVAAGLALGASGAAHAGATSTMARVPAVDLAEQGPVLDPDKLPLRPELDPSLRDEPVAVAPEDEPEDPGDGEGEEMPPDVVVDCWDPAEGHMVPCDELPDPEGHEEPEAEHDPEPHDPHEAETVYEHSAPVVRVTPNFTG